MYIFDDARIHVLRDLHGLLVIRGIAGSDKAEKHQADRYGDQANEAHPPVNSHHIDPDSDGADDIGGQFRDHMRDGAFHPLHLIDDDLLKFAAGSIDDRTKRHSRKLGKDLLPYRGKQGKGCPVADA